MSKKILVLLGHPDSDTFSGSIAEAYVRGAKEGKHKAELVHLGALEFDPILRKGYKEIQELEPDLVALQKAIKKADHLVIVYPNWWASMPALLKGMFDRMWLPGFAFNFDKATRQPIQRLAGKTARVIILSGSHSPFMMWMKYGDFTNEITRGILGFAGIRPQVTSLGPCERQSKHAHDKWIQQVERMGRKAE